VNSAARTFIVSWSATYLVQAYVSTFFLYPLFLKNAGYSFSLIGWLMSIFFIAATVARPFAGWMSEKLGIRKTFLLGALWLLVVSIPLLWVRSVACLLFLRAMLGAGFGLCMVSLTAHQALSFPEETRGNAFSLIALAYVLPQISVFPLSDLFLSSGCDLGYLMILPVLAGLTVIAAFYVPDLGSAEETGREPWGTWGELRLVRGLWPLLFSVFLFGLINSFGIQYIPPILGLQGLIPSAFLVANAVMSIIIRIAGSKLMDRISRKTFAGFTSAWLGLIILLVLTAGTNPAIVCMGLAYGLGMGFGFPIHLALVPDTVPAHLRPKGVALAFFAMDLGWIISSLAAGYVAEALGLRTLVALFGLIGLTGGLALYLFGWRPILRKP